MASTYSFSLLNDTKLKDTLNQRELRDCFMQWNLDNRYYYEVCKYAAFLDRLLLNIMD